MRDDLVFYVSDCIRNLKLVIRRSFCDDQKRHKTGCFYFSFLRTYAFTQDLLLLKDAESSLIVLMLLFMLNAFRFI